MLWIDIKTRIDANFNKIYKIIKNEILGLELSKSY